MTVAEDRPAPDPAPAPARPSRATSVFRWSSWIPLGAFAGFQIYLERFDGWGSWAAAPVLLVPIALSGIFMLAGLGVLRSERRTGGVTGASKSAFAFASGPFVWFFWRILVVTTGGG